MKNSDFLSDDELAALGVKRTITDYGHIVYEVPCSICGKTTRVLRFNPTRSYKCVICDGAIIKKREEKRRLARLQHEEELAEEIGVDAVHYRRFENGVKKFGPKHFFAIEQAEKMIGKYESVSEVIACIELLYIGARVIPHQKVGELVVDFCLPDEKLIIEIDGSIYHTDIDKEQRRDKALINMLGSDWVVKHVPAESVAKEHKAFRKAMKIYLDDRKFELRKEKRRVDY